MSDLTITNVEVGGNNASPVNPPADNGSVSDTHTEPKQEISGSESGTTNDAASVSGHEGGLSGLDSNPAETARLAELDAAEARLRGLITPPWQIAPWLKVHVYGRPGSGKTVFACDSGLRTLFIDIEEGSVSLNNHPEIAKNVEVIPFQSYRQMNALIEVMQSGRMSEFKVVVFDTWSELAKEETDRAFAGMTNPKAIANRPHAELAGGTDYQLANENMRKLAARLRGLDKHIVFVSHLKEEKDKTGVITRIRPNLSPGLVSTMDGFVSVLGYMSAEFKGTMGVVRTFQPMPDALVDAKTRIGGLPTRMQNASFADLLKANELMRQTAATS